MSEQRLRCTPCGQWKLVDEFYPSEIYRHRCKACSQKRTKAWSDKNKQHHRALTLAWHKAHPENLKNAYQRYAAKPGIRPKRNAATRAWQKRHPEKGISQYQRRRSKMSSFRPQWANRFFIEEIYHLAKLRTRLTGHKWHVDHIVPLHGKGVCGLHVENNLQVIPAQLNYRKNCLSWPDMP